MGAITVQGVRRDTGRLHTGSLADTPTSTGHSSGEGAGKTLVLARGNAMMIIDAQVHAYERNHPGRPWVGTLTNPAEVWVMTWWQRWTPSVAGAVLVSPSACTARRQLCARSPPAAPGTVRPRQADRLGGSGVAGQSPTGHTGTVGIGFLNRGGHSTSPIPAQPGADAAAEACRST
jgi:hypothetical protein